MSPPPLDPESFNLIHQEHRLLQRALADVDDALDKERSPVHIYQVIASLRNIVLQHFDDEESSGFFREISAVAPRLSEQSDFLLQQHDLFRDTLFSISELVHTQTGSPDWRDSLNEMFSQFRDEMLKHERQERELLQETYERDVGTGD